jgi:hypothetical protein
MKMAATTFNILDKTSQELMKQTKDGRSFRKKQKGIKILEEISKELSGFGVTGCIAQRVLVTAMLAKLFTSDFQPIHLALSQVMIHKLVYCLAVEMKSSTHYCRSSMSR